MERSLASTVVFSKTKKDSGGLEWATMDLMEDARSSSRRSMRQANDEGERKITEH